MFEDPDFPADGSSIGNLAERSATWRRAPQLNGVDSASPQVFGQLEAENIQQGQLGDCWLLAAIAALADFPGHVMDLFSPRECSPEGKYEIRLHDVKRGWQTVTIDDRIPCLPLSRQPCFVQVPDAGDIWVLLLEKAFAKFCGTYEALDGGGSTWAYQALTGITKQLVYTRTRDLWSQWHVDVEKQQKDPDEWRKSGMRGTGLTSKSPLTKYASDEFFGILAYFDQASSSMAASLRGSGTREGRRDDGLIEGHAYSLLEVQKVHGQCMIKLRNPWGESEWNGEYSDSSDAWDKRPDIAEDLKVEEENNGEFWMPYEKFSTIYDSIMVSPGTLSVPKQSRIGGRKKEGVKCGYCRNVMARVWCCTDASSGVDGEWVRMEDGDHCFMCRKAKIGLAEFRPELQKVAGIDRFQRWPELFQPKPPRQKEICKYGPNCYRFNPEHYADYAHPWLGLRIKAAPWKMPSGSVGAPSSPSAAGGGGGGGEDLDSYAHQMLNAFKNGDWDTCTSLLKSYPGIVDMHPDGRKWAMIHRAAAFGQMEYMVPLVEEYNADVDLRAGDGMTPLQIAQRGGHAEVVDFIRGKSDGGEPSSTSSSDLPPEDAQYAFLRQARRRRWPQALQALTDCPKLVNCKPPGEKFYAIHHGAFQGKLDILQCLVDSFHASVSVMDGDGRTALQTARHFGHSACETFLSSIGDDDASAGVGGWSAMSSGITSHSARVITRPADVLEGANPTVGDVVAEGEDDVDEATACISEATWAAKRQRWDKLFEVLGRCPEAAGSRPAGRTWAPPHHAARWGSVDVLRRLVEEFSVTPSLLSAERETLADVAERYGHAEAADFLRAAELRALSGLRSDSEEKILEAFRSWDKDGDGSISKEEMRQVMTTLSSKWSLDNLDRVFVVADSNQDGCLDYEEFMAWLFQ